MPTLTTVCSWCDPPRPLSARPDPLNVGGVTHTICPPCLERHYPDPLREEPTVPKPSIRVRPSVNQNGAYHPRSSDPIAAFRGMLVPVLLVVGVVWAFCEVASR